jgi:hypothetical protein
VPAIAGLNSFTVRVDAAGGSDIATLEVTVVPDTTLPPVPNGLTAVAGDGFVSLNWTDSRFNESLQSAEVSASPAESSAGIIADYRFDGASMISFDSDPNSTAGAIADGGGLNASYENRNGRGDPRPALKWTVGDMNDGTLLDSDYLVFTMNPAADLSLSFSELSFTFKFPNAETDVSLYTSEDGFTGDAVATYNYPGGGDVLTITLDLSAMPPVSRPVEFRLYLDTAASFGTADVWIDNIQLRGSSTAISADPDGDDDGIADAWEELYFPSTSSIDGSLDSDGDGVLDFFEYLFGSIPINAASGGFSFGVGDGLVGTGIVFDWEVQEGFVLGSDYDVAVSTDLGAWVPLPVEHFTLEESTSDGRTQLELEIIHDYGTKVFLRLVSP